jgi:hypothetical protein
VKTQNSVDGQKAASATNEELMEMANEGDTLHMEMAHRIRVLTVNLRQCEAREMELLKQRNCEECGWPSDACCCEPVTHPDNPTFVRRCGECGGDHEPSGARSDCILHWKRRAIEAENACLVNKIYGVPATIAAHEND